ncbi:MAG TPA: hypothetical protein VKR83_05605 [Ktedonobacteraceae bacterium]|nr:hypothetical protein [Ktedonobacteraceae bacterium]
MQQQEQMNFDLLAVFNAESDADAAETKLHKEGFGDDEVFRMAAGSVSGGQFREHGPDRDRSTVFLQTTRSGPNPLAVIVLVVVFGVILGAVAFGAADFAIKSIPVLPSTIAGAVVGVILGAIIGLTRRGRVRGAIGQDLARVSAAKAQPTQESRTVIAIRLPDPDNISRKSKARAILLNNRGKIDRSVGG